MLVCLILRTNCLVKVLYFSDTPIVESGPLVIRSSDPTIIEDLLEYLPFVTESWNPLILPKESKDFSQ
uniref:ORF3 n=1 Tax=Tomato chlorosis virus TaxID=67754 RepID=A0A5J6YJA3_9CLOS|nr:p8 [Tomato chlorosis virus]QXE32453.1 ORF3 [Tomato chlorosis virus]QZX45251.1 ORF3 [Tomato chlorosis virus]WND60585.1 P8 [Tomato chlorosis virus]